MIVRIGDHNLEGFGLHILSVEFGTAEIKEVSVDIPGASGKLDLTEAITGYPLYDNAVHIIRCDFRDGTYKQWLDKARHIKGLLHGRKMRVVFNDEPYYYTARVRVDTEKINQYYSGVDITLDAEPYRVSTMTTLDPLWWASFGIDADEAIDYSKITIPATVTLHGDVMPTGIVVTVADDKSTSPPTMTFEGQTYMLHDGSNPLDIIVKTGPNELIFAGSGTVSVEYRWGRF